MQIFRVILIAVAFTALAPAALAALYYAVLVVASLLPRRNRTTAPASPTHRFGILIPAHNEENQVGNAVQSCRQLDYPKDRFCVWVIADNCTDRTAEVAQSLGANFLLRTDVENRGKGYALAYGFETLLQSDYDAFLILDADCVIDPGALREFDDYLRSGDRALQAADCVSNIDDNPISYTLAVGNLTENRLFYTGKSRLGLPVMLRGTGMVLHRDLLERLPWNAHSIVEDQEYFLKLTRAGILVRFVDRVGVRSPFPTDRRQLSIQRERWSKGSLSFGKSQACKLMLEGISRASFRLFDAGWMLLVLSRPLLLACLISAVFLCIASHWLMHTWLTDVLFKASMALAAFYALYFSLGVILLGLTLKRFCLLLRAPLVLVHLVWISLRGLAGAKNLQWNRTPR